jgi:hypothetical protein
MTKLTVTKSVHGMDCIEITDEKIAPKLKAAIADNYMNSPAYQARAGSGAFLQGYDEKTGWCLIEFWTPNYHAFVDYLNSVIHD